jgi:hypothetical protein
MAESSERALTPDEPSYVAAARDNAFMRYEAERIPHRSCEIAVAGTTPAHEVAALAAATLRRFASERPAIIALEDP